MNRGNRREAIFRSDDDRGRFLGRLAELPARYRTEIHAFALMDDHFHLVVHVQDANLSEAMRWLQVSYSSAFNWAHRIRGHVFQGRYHSLLIEDLQGVVEAHGSWLRDAVLYTAVRHLGHRLVDVCRGVPGLNYPAAAQGVMRFGRMLEDDPAKQRFVRHLRHGWEQGRESTGQDAGSGGSDCHGWVVAGCDITGRM